MKIKQLHLKISENHDIKLRETYSKFNQLIFELRKKELPEDLIIRLNEEIEEISLRANTEKNLRKDIKKTQTSILKTLEKEVKIVPKNYYQNLWLGLGMTIFGIPFGIVLGTSLGNASFSGLGLPIGMGIGIAIGSEKDKKAFTEGRQLDIEIRS